MKEEYDFSKGKRGAIVPTPAGKTRITIRLDNEVIDWFRDQVESKGSGNYQTMINNVLREYICKSGEYFKEIVRRAVKEEIREVAHSIGPLFRPQETAVNDNRMVIPKLEFKDFSGTSAGEVQNYILDNVNTKGVSYARN